MLRVVALYGVFGYNIMSLGINKQILTKVFGIILFGTAHLQTHFCEHTQENKQNS